jgi:tetraacyldisaccharide 4'-kinase
VVSVGNLTVGGTGKTPLVIWLARQLQTKGCRVGVLSRGYGRNNTLPFLLISNGQQILLGPSEAGDEPYLMACRLPGVVVAVGANRYEVGRKVLEQLPIDWFILDDGFQHLKLSRDENFLLVDSSNFSPAQQLLPAGRLREPLSAGKRATEIILTRVQDVSQSGSVVSAIEQAMEEKINPILTKFTVTFFEEVRTQQSVLPREMVRKKAILFCGIGNPKSFQASVAECGLHILETCIFQDHYVYQNSDWISLQGKAKHSGADMILTTEKDAVKVKQFVQRDEFLWVVHISVEVISGEERLEHKLGVLNG